MTRRQVLSPRGTLVLALLAIPSTSGAETLPSPPQPPGAVVVAEVAEIRTPLRIVEPELFHEYTVIGLRVEEVLAGDAPDSFGVYIPYTIHIDGSRTSVEPNFATERLVPILVPGQRAVVGVWLPDERSVPFSTPGELRTLWRWWGRAYMFHERGGEEALAVASDIILAEPIDDSGVARTAEEIVERSRQAFGLPYVGIEEVRRRLQSEFVERVENFGRR